MKIPLICSPTSLEYAQQSLIDMNFEEDPFLGLEPQAITPEPVYIDQQQQPQWEIDDLHLESLVIKEDPHLGLQAVAISLENTPEPVAAHPWPECIEVEGLGRVEVVYQQAAAAAEKEVIIVDEVHAQYPHLGPLGVDVGIHTVIEAAEDRQEGLLIAVAEADQNVEAIEAMETDKENTIAKVLVVPPRDLKVPVLPVRFDDRLLFTLCKACALNYPDGARADNYSCPHSEQTPVCFTCTHMELNEAFDVGYVATHIFRVMEYDKWSDDVFKGYVREFYKIKLEASGFPEGINTDEQKRRFIQATKTIFDITIDENNVKKNNAMRTLAKICLNSLWNRFSLRNFLSKTFVIDDAFDLYNYMNDAKIEITATDEISPNLIMLTYKPKLEFVEEHSSSNVVISLWTTSAARIRLLKALQTVAATPGCKLSIWTRTQ